LSGGESQIPFFEAREHPPISREPAKEPFDFIAAAI
jgi:hypothetical protein